jgi:5-methylcytosine-specific restriction endonuclease McrA
MAKYYKKNIDKIRERNKEYCLQNKDKVAQKRKQYYKSEKGKQIVKIVRAKRKSAFKKLQVAYTLEEWEDCLKYFKHSCCYCGNPGPMEQDHFIALSKGGEYTRNNIVPACKSCNSSKNNKDFFEWYPKQSFYNRKRESKILKFLHYKNQIQQLSFII